jgi:CysZ protein
MSERGRSASNNPLTGAGYLLRGFRLLARSGIKRYVVAPLLVNIIVFGTLFYLLWSQFGSLRTYVEGWLPDWLDFLSWLLLPLVVLLSALVLFFGFSALGNLFAAPFNGFLAEAVERTLTGTAPEASGGFASVMREAARDVRSQIRKLGYFVSRAVPLLLFFLVPGLNLAAPFLWFAFSAWMLAVEYADYAMANHGLSFSQQRDILAHRRWLALGFGGATSVALLVPGLNLAVIPAAVAGATALWVEQLAPELRPGGAGR